MSLIAWYPLNGDTKDYSGNNKHLTNNGATVSNLGKIGKTYDFGSGKYMTRVDEDIRQTFNSSEFSISMWYYVTDSSTFALSMGSTTASKCLHIGLRSITQITFAFYGDDYNLNYNFSANKWYNLVWVYKDNKQYIYIDGVLMGSRVASANLNIDANSTMNVGVYNSSLTSSRLNDIRIYSHALSLSEIKEISKAKILHYKFDDCQESTVNYGTNSLLTKEYFGGNLRDLGSYYQKVGNKILVNNQPSGGPLPGWRLNIKSGDCISVSGKTDISTIQIYYKGFDSSGNVIINQTSKNVTVVNGVYKETIQITGTGLSYIHIGIGHTGTPNFILNENMIEIKDHCTKFINGTREGIITDCSGYDNNSYLTLENSPKWVNDSAVGTGSYKFGNGQVTNVYNDVKQNIVTSKFAASRQITVSAWVKHDTLTGNWRWPIACLGKTTYSTTASNNQILFCIEENKPRVHLWSGLDSICNKTTNDNKWHHVAFTFDYDTKLLNIYIDGVVNVSNVNTTEGTSVMSIDENNRWQIGCNLSAYAYGDNISGYKSTFEGFIDDVRIYATILSAEDIKRLYINKGNLDSNGTLNVHNIKEQTEYEVTTGVNLVRLKDNTTLPVYCNMDIEGGNWVRIFHHNVNTTVSWFENNSQAAECNVSSPMNNVKYSILSKLESFRDESGKFTFMLRYPNEGKRNIWKQTSNPNSETIKGYEAISIDYSENYWGGLEPDTGGNTYMDGSVGHGNWYYSIGSKVNYSSNSIPSGNNGATKEVELYVKINNNVSGNVKGGVGKKGELNCREVNEVGCVNNLVLWSDLEHRGVFEKVSNFSIRQAGTINRTVKTPLGTIVPFLDNDNTTTNCQYFTFTKGLNALKQSAKNKEWTISASFYIETLPQQSESIVLGKAGNHEGLIINGSNAMFRWLEKTDSTSTVKTITRALTTDDLNKWHTITTTYNSGVIKFYFDGGLIKEQTLTSGTNFNSTADVWLMGGNSGWTSYKLNGAISNVRIYEKELTSSEVLSVHSSFMRKGMNIDKHGNIYTSNIDERL